MLFPLVAAALLFAPTRLPEPVRDDFDLVVLVVVDQLRPDYFDRFAAQLEGGLARLRTRGAFYPDARQDHALTQTAPGHSTLLSGRFPAHTGIVVNDRGVPDSLAPLLEVPGAVGASPRRFRGTTLYDWMLAHDPETRVLSVSRKDRGAILLVGRARGAVYWWARGRFTTSRWYADTLPDWVRAYNRKQPARRLAGAVWRPLLPADAYPEPDSLPYEGDGRGPAFPHRMPRDPEAAGVKIIGFPWMDSLTLDFALEGVRRTGLGRRGRPDLLVVSLSTLDQIGHEFGSESREVHDHFLRLDRWLGRFLDSLGTLVPPERTLLALAADHGVAPSPGWLRMEGRPGGRQWLGDLAARVDRELAARWRTRFDVDFEYGVILADVDAMRRRGIAVDSLADALAEDVRRRPGVTRVFTPASLAAAGDDSVAALWRRSLAPDDGWLIAAELADGWIWSRRDGTANHGTTRVEDMRIPLAIVGPGVAPGTYRRTVRSVDLAPTLAALLGIRPTEPLDGRLLVEVLPSQGDRR